MAMHVEPVEFSGRQFNLLELSRILRRHWRVLALAIILCTGAGVAYALLAAPVYQSTARMLIDTRRAQLFSPQQSVVSSDTFDAASVESQVEVIRSENLARSVIRDLKLLDDPDFMPKSSGLGSMIMARIARLLGNESHPTAEDRVREALSRFGNNLKINRLGITYVIEISFSARTPQLAARIANGVAAGYIAGELDAKRETTRRATVWLQDRISELREQTFAADRAVQSFKADNNLVTIGRSLISDQQLAELSTQLTTARGLTAETHVRLEWAQRALKDGMPDATTIDSLKSDVLGRLRQQIVDLTAREQDWSRRFGRDNSASESLRTSLKQAQRAFEDELRRLAEVYRGEFEVAKAREEAIQTNLGHMLKVSADTDLKAVGLRELESSAQSYKGLYDSMLTKFMEASQQALLPTTDARIITAAFPPSGKSEPRTMIVLAVSGVLGLMAGLGVAFLREATDRVVRRPDQIEAATGAECLGLLTEIPAGKALPLPAVTCTGERQIRCTTLIERYSVIEPTSLFTETLRSIRVAIDVESGDQAQIIGITSTLPGEGKSTIALNLARLIAHGGHRVLLIDGDLRRRALTLGVSEAGAPALVEVLRGEVPVSDVLWQCPDTGMHFLPVGAYEGGRHMAELIPASGLAQVLSWTREAFDYVLIDLPPLVPVVDVRAANRLIDRFVLVAEWGQTTQDVIRTELAANRVIRDKLLGVVLNRIDPRFLKQIDANRGSRYGTYLQPSQPELAAQAVPTWRNAIPRMLASLRRGRSAPRRREQRGGAGQAPPAQASSTRHGGEAS
ncbi:Tyrosine-protein kinase wzc [Methylobacterium tardum]|uniref:Chain-length determining protein n=2 Tax=Methylobacterium tardum TaxID=374432 RepID=A0AA37TNZ9_9HYPH|nr:Wzz/FepE/Etk N-terminal domain-containing protein [Methylobacterium tardum]GJE50432.1 Tyrosine-protein kinase wzc [Methylobacterium tardum]GLS71853.1 chain-length determining protein [Methylobacterium tardum]